MGWQFYQGDYGEPVSVPAGAWKPAEGVAAAPPPSWETTAVPSPWSAPAAPAAAPAVPVAAAAVSAMTARAAAMEATGVRPAASAGAVLSGHPASASAASTVAPGPSGGGWDGRDVAAVLLWGLLGGVWAGLALSLWYWLLNEALSFLALWELPMGSGAAVYAGMSALLLTTHGLFVGLRRRKPGVIIATLVLSLITFVPTDVLMDWVLYPEYADFSMLPERVGTTLLYTGGSMLAVGLVGELLRAAMGRLQDLVLARALIGFAVPVGWTLSFVVQRAVFMEYSWAMSFELLDWALWLGPMAVAGFVFAGLLPAALSGSRGGTAAAPGQAGSAGSYAASASYHASVPGYPAPGMLGAPEHPKATQILVCGLLGVFVLAPLAIVAWVMGSKAKAEMAREPERYRPSSSVQTGYVLGIIGTVLMVPNALLIVGLLVLVASGSLSR